MANFVIIASYRVLTVIQKERKDCTVIAENKHVLKSNQSDIARKSVPKR